MSKRRRKHPAKPRQTSVMFDMGKPVSLAAIKTLADGRVVLVDHAGQEHSPVAGIIERSYEREHKGPKILSQTALNPAVGIRFHPDDGLLAFPTVFVLDTNTRPDTGLSASCVATVFPQRGISFFIQGMEFANSTCHPDLFALRMLLTAIDAKLGVDRDKARFAVVVDSNLADLRAIQERTRPILGDYYLPEWAYMTFASDAAGDMAVNKIMRVADKRASELLDYLERTGGAGSKADAAPYATFARWYYPSYSGSGICPGWIPAQSAPLEQFQEKLAAMGIGGAEDRSLSNDSHQG